jgi:hypothetical protein
MVTFTVRGLPVMSTGIGCGAIPSSGRRRARNQQPHWRAAGKRSATMARNEPGYRADETKASFKTTELGAAIIGVVA